MGKVDASFSSKSRFCTIVSSITCVHARHAMGVMQQRGYRGWSWLELSFSDSVINYEDCGVKDSTRTSTT